MSKKHAKYSPSGSSGWMRCVGYESSASSSPYAAEGTCAHDLCERAINEPGFYIDAMVGQEIEVEGYKVVVDIWMVERVKRYVEYVTELGGRAFCEVELDLEPITGELNANGTADYVTATGDHLHVVDLKYGFAKVSADDNSQMQIYALAALQEFDPLGLDIKAVTLHIFQPRINNIVSWSISRHDLEQFADIVHDRVQAHIAGTEPRNPGAEQCYWCARAGNCAAQTQLVMASITDDFVDLTLELDTKLSNAVTLVESVDSATLSRMARCAPLIEQWVKAVELRVKNLLEKGEVVEGFKLVEGRLGNRKWSDERALLEALGSQASAVHDTVLMSPTVAQKRVPKAVWEKIEAFVSRAPGQPTVVESGDKRPPLNQIKL